MTTNARSKPRIVPLEKIPNRIYYSISEASEFTGVEPHVLRYWETKFSKLNPKRVGGNQRKYTRSDIELLYEIVHLLYQEGYTLDGAERKLRIGLQALKQEHQVEETDQPEIKADPLNRSNSSANSKTTLADIKKELEELLHLLG
ncbi:MAG: MerR family transcriptional regulator [bacterium]|jgi:DNA-binding transcriptional MerR regulator|nr:MerR family transcriptional regulator [bacterium]